MAPDIARARVERRVLASAPCRWGASKPKSGAQALHKLTAACVREMSRTPFLLRLLELRGVVFLVPNRTKGEHRRGVRWTPALLGRAPRWRLCVWWGKHGGAELDEHNRQRHILFRGGRHGRIPVHRCGPRRHRGAHCPIEPPRTTQPQPLRPPPSQRAPPSFALHLSPPRPTPPLPSASHFTPPAPLPALVSAVLFPAPLRPRPT